MQLFDGQSENGVSAEFKVFSSRELVNVWVAGDLGGGTITVEARAPDDATWVTVNGSSITEAQMITLEAAPFVARLRLSGATTPNVNAWAERDGYYWRRTVKDA